jgi:hypothetical protein
MKKQFSLPLLLLVVAACSASANMNLNSFNQIDLGESSTHVVSSVGQPYSVQQKGDGVVEYKYIERIKAGGRDLEDRYYFLTIKDGKVIGKEVVYVSPAPYLYDSYEMQTSQINQLSPSDD